MEVILLESVNNLGVLGDKVKVKAGYARNFLVPTRKAVFATTVNIVKFEARRAELERHEAEKLAEAQARGEKIHATKVTITAAVSDEGKLYGSVGPAELVEALAQRGLTVCKSEVTMPEGVIRFIGDYDITLILHSKVHVVVHVAIVSDTPG
jgi:large subunit ribosomal protein L9